MILVIHVLSSYNSFVLFKLLCLCDTGNDNVQYLNLFRVEKVKRIKFNQVCKYEILNHI